MSTYIETFLQTASERLQQRDIAGATTVLQELLASHPACAPGLQMLGMVSAIKGDKRGAARLLRHACVVEPENGSLRLHLARVEWEIGMPAQAAASYEQAIACHCVSSDIRTDYAVTLQALKQGLAALAQCETVLAEDPCHARAWNTKADILHEQNRLEEALACHERAVALAPDARGWSGMAATLDAMGRLASALACHDMAIACDPGNPAIWTKRGATLAKMGHHQQALACHIHATGLDPTLATAWSNLGALLTSYECGDEAVAAHDKAISLQPSSATLWLQRGVTLMALKRNVESLASFNAAIHLDPASARAWHHRAMILCAERRLHEAVETLDEAISLDPSLAAAVMLRDAILQWLEQGAESPAEMPCNVRVGLEIGANRLAPGNLAAGWSGGWIVRRLEANGSLRDAPPRTCGDAEDLQGMHLPVLAERGHVGFGLKVSADWFETLQKQHTVLPCVPAG